MEQLLSLLSSGKYLPAVGLVLVALVGAARAGIGAYVPWLRTKLGGYVLGFGSATLLYVGTSLEADQGVSIGLLSSALAAGWVAAGGWEHLQDVLNLIKSKSDPDASSLPAATVVPKSAGVVAKLGSIVLVCALVFGCTGANRQKIAADALSVTLTISADINKTNDALIQAGIQGSASTVEAGEAKLVKYRAARDKVRGDVPIVIDAEIAFLQLNSDLSFSKAQAAFAQLATDVATMKGIK